ncbi:DUF7507 domain-containing protein [Chelativorans salis]|uniref:DUF7507 domain-containing protein n=1 Tax=Chelativorans salis TaxID=2978478 RepID=A0ABT2LN70_9HYPH|nr:hypothetical protein [Chelativorans sp. EGI FJ00035]MCT7376015.1 hypothetical protein [Chelativorans sp. EGI FJ00035]
MFLKVAAFAVAATVVGTAEEAQAQTPPTYIKRNFSNLDFEIPDGSCQYIAQDDAGGWLTTHDPMPTNCGGRQVTAPVIEYWNSGSSSGTGRYVELNAEQDSLLYQEICLVEGDRVKWELSHRGRVDGAGPVYDTMEFKIAQDVTDKTNRVATVTTSTDGIGACTEHTEGGVANPTACNFQVLQNGWVGYSGAFTWNSATAIQPFGFGAVSTGSGNTTVGNFLDDIRLTIVPVIELGGATEGPEDPSATVPHLIVVGNVDNAFTVTVKVTGGTATLGVDYTTSSGTDTFDITIPPGNYEGDPINLPIEIQRDEVDEQKETIAFELQPTDDPQDPEFLLKSTTICGDAAGQSTWEYTINDIFMEFSKEVVEIKDRNGTPDQQDVGDEIHYQFILENKGDVPLVSVGMQDDKVANPTPGSGVPADATSPLAPGGTAIWTGIYPLDSDDFLAASVTNKATATASPEGIPDYPLTKEATQTQRSMYRARSFFSSRPSISTTLTRTLTSSRARRSATPSRSRTKAISRSSASSSRTDSSEAR